MHEQLALYMSASSLIYKKIEQTRELRHISASLLNPHVPAAVRSNDLLLCFFEACMDED